MVSATAPNLLYVLGIPGGSLVVCALLCYGLYRVLTALDQSRHH